ncbi:hypothetical protein GQ44DRAFT_739933 [Phaeosphaeriaceae sp. PMI808]|nr:hypothetical protein GQ44DRAFT_739933 [Phaeosphaeriaceae sp. PMI808]
MMFPHAICVLFAPAVVRAAAFPWALPEPTVFMAVADNWSPAPTPAPRLGELKLFRRQQETDNTCGFLSGLRESSITCYNTNEICATNTYNGVHGCCNPKSLSYCSIPTTCIPSSAMATACTDAACSSNGLITKCTDSGLPACYKWIFQYSKTLMTQHGCDSKGFTITVPRSPGLPGSSIPPELFRTVTSTVFTTPPPSSSAIPTALPKPSKPPIGTIVGATIGGCTFISLIVIAIYFLHRRRKVTARNSVVQPPPAVFQDANGTVTEYNALGFPTTKFPETAETKRWQERYAGPVHRENNSIPQYPGMAPGMNGVVEVDGVQRPVEAPAEHIYYAREYVRS